MFADDGALLASTRSVTEHVAVSYQQVSKDFGLTDSIPKTKYMVNVRLVEETDQEPIMFDDGILKL